MKGKVIKYLDGYNCFYRVGGILEVELSKGRLETMVG
jgi:hypothetical protein